MGEGMMEIAHSYLDWNFCKSEECEKVKEKAFYNDEAKMGTRFERPRYRHPAHQLPRINPHAKQGNQRGTTANRGGRRGGFRGNVANRGETNPFNRTPEKSGSEIYQGTPPDNFSNPIKNVHPPKPTPNVPKKGKNKFSNFGYSDTDPVLHSQTEESKVEVAPRPKIPKKPKAQPVGAHVFDPSKTVNMPPPPKPHPKHQNDPSNPGPYSNVPKQNYPIPTQTHPQYPVSPPQTAFASQPVPIGGEIHNREPQPVIAATKVKPPTASMKPKVARPIQRYAPHPRMQSEDHPNQAPAGGPPKPIPSSTHEATAPPSRGRMPPMRGRGAPPMARGGSTRGTPRGGMHAPVPMNPNPSAPNAGAPAPSPGPGSIPSGAPPPPKIGSRVRGPGAQ